jgi:solute carrier family 25 protein 33/36
MATAVLTSPLDVLRTRLQSDFYRDKLARPAPAPHGSILRSGFRHISETFHILYSIQHTEGWRGFFRGLGPSLTGVVPASAVKFYAYGNAKTFLHERAGLEKDSPLLHLISATAASISTSTATNPIWLVKTRLQLDKADAERSGARRYKNSLDCVRQVLRQEGVRGFYRGLGVSYLGAGETALHLTLYEQLKIVLNGRQAHAREGTMMGELSKWLNVGGAAAGSKVIAVLVSYPHEVRTLEIGAATANTPQVIRTRIRQEPMANGKAKYTGIVQCFRLMWKEEGLASLYGGLTAHLLRAVPSAAITLGGYEVVLRLLNAQAKRDDDDDGL